MVFHRRVYKLSAQDLLMELEPMLIILTGIPATGKTETRKELMLMISNSFVLEKDLINQGILHVIKDNNPKLLPFEEYVKGDDVFPNCIRQTKTSFGDMMRIDPKNAFYLRHGKFQTYLIMQKLAAENLNNGKVPIIDCFPISYLINGSLQIFMNHHFFDSYQKHLIHFTADLDDLFLRYVERAKLDEEAARRDIDKIGQDPYKPDRDLFDRFVTEKQPPVPQELENYKYLLINTSRGTSKQCARQCLDYLLG